MKLGKYRATFARTLSDGTREQKACAILELPPGQNVPMVNAPGTLENGVYKPVPIPGFRIWRKLTYKVVRPGYSEGDPRAMTRDAHGRLVILHSDPQATPDYQITGEEYGPTPDCGYATEQEVIDLLVPKHEEVLFEEPVPA